MSSGGSRVSIPSDVKKTIQGIKKEIAGKRSDEDMLKDYSDEDIYAVLKDCNMDANETAQRLVYIGTFQEVKKKHNRSKVNVNSRASEGSRRTTGTQGQGARGGQVNSSTYMSQGLGGKRNMNARQENGTRVERVMKPSSSAPEKMDNVNPRVRSSSINSVDGPKSGSGGSSSHEPGIQSSPATHDTANKIEATVGDMSSSKTRPKESKSVENHQPLKSATLAVEAGSVSLHEINVSLSEEATSKLDKKLEKLNISADQLVIFPNHFQVPEDFKNGLVFGSLDSTSEHNVQCVNCSDDQKDSMPPTQSPMGTDKPDSETSMSNASVPSTAQEGEYRDDPHYLPPHMPYNAKSSNDSVSSAAAPSYDQLKQTVMVSQGGPPYPFVPTALNYGFPPMQSILGSQIAQCERREPQSGNSLVSSTSGSTPTAIQPGGVGQSSIALSPPPFPVLPYPPSYFPYGPYYPPYYLASNAQQFLGQRGFPQQPSTGNLYLSPPAAAQGGKFAVPPNKPGLNAGNPTQFGVPFGYGSYSPSLSGTSGSSAGNEDRTASELKNKAYTSVQGEGPLVWYPPSGRDMPSLHANSFYNHLPQAGHAPFSGIYHPAPTMAATSTPPMAESIEAGEPHQQPQHAATWNSNY